MEKMSNLSCFAQWGKSCDSPTQVRNVETGMNQNINSLKMRGSFMPAFKKYVSRGWQTIHLHNVREAWFIGADGPQAPFNTLYNFEHNKLECKTHSFQVICLSMGVIMRNVNKMKLSYL